MAKKIQSNVQPAYKHATIDDLEELLKNNQLDLIVQNNEDSSHMYYRDYDKIDTQKNVSQEDSHVLKTPEIQQEVSPTFEQEKTEVNFYRPNIQGGYSLPNASRWEPERNYSLPGETTVSMGKTSESTPKYKANFLGRTTADAAQMFVKFTQGAFTLVDGVVDFTLAKTAGGFLDLIGANNAANVMRDTFGQYRLSTDIGKSAAMLDPYTHKPFESEKWIPKTSELAGEIAFMYLTGEAVSSGLTSASNALSKSGPALKSIDAMFAVPAGTSSMMIPKLAANSYRVGGTLARYNMVYSNRMSSYLEKGYDYQKASTVAGDSALIAASMDYVTRVLYGAAGDPLVNKLASKTVVDSEQFIMTQLSTSEKVLTELKSMAGVATLEGAKGVVRSATAIEFERMMLDPSMKSYFKNENGELSLTQAGNDFLLNTTISAIIQIPSRYNHIKDYYKYEQQAMKSLADMGVKSDRKTIVEIKDTGTITYNPKVGFEADDAMKHSVDSSAISKDGFSFPKENRVIIFNKLKDSDIPADVRINMIDFEISKIDNIGSSGVNFDKVDIEGNYEYKQELLKIKDDIIPKANAEELGMILGGTKVSEAAVAEMGESFVANELYQEIKNTQSKVASQMDKNKTIKVNSNKVKTESNFKDNVDDAITIVETINSNSSTTVPLKIVSAKNNDQKTAIDIGAAFGKQIIFVEGGDVSGFSTDHNSDILFINTNIDSDLIKVPEASTMYVLGHELFHSLKADSPTELGDFISTFRDNVSVEQIINFIEKYEPSTIGSILNQLKIDGKLDMAELLSNPSKYPEQLSVLDGVLEEMIANEFGGALVDPSVWSNIAGTSTKIPKPLATAIEKALNEINEPVYDSPMTQPQIDKIRSKFLDIIRGIDEEELVETPEKSPAKQELSKVEEKEPSMKEVIKPTTPEPVQKPKLPVKKETVKKEPVKKSVIKKPEIKSDASEEATPEQLAHLFKTTPEEIKNIGKKVDAKTKISRKPLSIKEPTEKDGVMGEYQRARFNLAKSINKNISDMSKDSYDGSEMRRKGTLFQPNGEYQLKYTIEKDDETGSLNYTLKQGNKTLVDTHNPQTFFNAIDRKLKKHLENVSGKPVVDNVSENKSEVQPTAIKPIVSDVVKEDIAATPDSIEKGREYLIYSDHENNDYLTRTLVESEKKIDSNQEKVYNIEKEEGKNAQREFRDLQEESRELINRKDWGTKNKGIDDELRERLRRVLPREIQRRSSGTQDDKRAVKLSGNSNHSFEMVKGTDPELFHDVFEIVRAHTTNGELVDVQEAADYVNNTNYMSKDGMQGFSITPKGDLVSVYNADNTKRGFLSAINDIVYSDAKTLDCFMSDKQPLHQMYEKTFGFKIAATMDYNMEYDQYNIGANHNEPKIAFMVNSSFVDDFEPKHFGKDQYDEAIAYRDSLLQDTPRELSVEELSKDDGSYVNIIKETYDWAVEYKDPEILNNSIRDYKTYLKDGGTERIKELDDVIADRQRKFREMMNKTMGIKKLPTKERRTFASMIQPSSPIAKGILELHDEGKLDILYNVKTNEMTRENVLNDLIERGDDVIQEFFVDSNLSSEKAALGEALIKYYQHIGDSTMEAMTTNHLLEMGTSGGQFIQYLSNLSQTNPSLYMNGIQKQLDKINDVLHSSKDPLLMAYLRENAGGIVLTDAEQDFLYHQVEKMMEMEDGDYDKHVLHTQIITDIQNKIPKSLSEKILEARRIGLLYNPKTILRNFLGNGPTLPLNISSHNIAGVPVDKWLSKKTGVRTTDKYDLKYFKKDFKKGIDQALQDFTLGISTDPTQAFEKPMGKVFSEKHNFKNKSVNKIADAFGKTMNNLTRQANLAMDIGDRGFFNYYYDQELQNFEKLNGGNPPNDIQRGLAKDRALRLTWKHEGGLFKASRTIRRLLNTPVRYSNYGLSFGEYKEGETMGFGAGTVSMVFIMTPANLANAIYDYSPLSAVSIVKAGINLQKAIETGIDEDIHKAQRKLVDRVSYTHSGVILWTVAAALIAAAHKSSKIEITGNYSKDAKLRQLQLASGFKPYAIKIDDKYYTYSWSEPTGAALGVLTDQKDLLELNKQKGKDTSIEEMLESALYSVGDTMMEQSYLLAVAKLFGQSGYGGYGGDGVSEDIIGRFSSLGEEAISQMVPSFIRNLANFIDDNVKDPYYKDSKSKTVSSRILQGIPGAKSTLTTRKDIFGQDVKVGNKSQNPVEKFINSFINPSLVGNEKYKKEVQELMRVYTNTNSTAILPREISRDITYKHPETKVEVKKTLTPAQRAKMQEIAGKTYHTTLKQIMDNNIYQNMTYPEKEQVLHALALYSQDIGIADSKILKDYRVKSNDAKTILKYTKEGLSVPTALIYKSVMSNIEGLKNNEGKTISGSASGLKAHAVMNMNVSDKEKTAMLKLIAPTAKNPETPNSLSGLSSEEDFIYYYGLQPERRESYVLGAKHFNLKPKEFATILSSINKIEADTSNGKAIPNSRKQKVQSYLNMQGYDPAKKAYLFHLSGYSVKDQQMVLFNYINQLRIPVSEKQEIWKSLGF